MVGLLLAATALSGGILYYTLSSGGVLGSSRSETPVAVPTAEPVRTVAALGRLEPAGEIIKLAGPLSLDGDRVSGLKVKVGDRVQPGQVVAVLDAYDRLQTELVNAQQQVKVAEAKLAQVQAGAKRGQIEAQRAEVARTQAQTLGEERAQREVITRLEAQWTTERAEQQATIERLAVQWEGDRTAQAATIRKLQAQYRTAQAEYQRNQQLFAEGAISQSLIDEKRLSAEERQQDIREAEAVLARINRTSEQQLREARTRLERINRTSSAQLSEARAVLARIQTTGAPQAQSAAATLNEIAEVRPVDVQAAQAELNSAIATVQQAKTNLQKALVRSPIKGQVLKIHTHPGEKLSSDGIVELGATDTMLAIAEVYQSDIQRVKLGQTATITGQAFEGNVRGQVSEIGRQVSRQNVFSNQPGENLDRRIVEVKIRLTPEASQKVANLTNLQIQAIIQP